MENNLLSLIIFAPLAGAAINWFVGRRVRDERFIGIVACGSVAISTLVAFYLALKPGGALTLRRLCSITSGRGSTSVLSALTSRSRWIV